MPSNVVGAQRARLIANYTLDFGWKPYILSVNPDLYVSISAELKKLVREGIDVTFVDADNRSLFFKGVGDLTLKCFNNLKSRAIEIINNEKIDFVWYPIPSYYNALLARPIYKVTRVPYGIDYIDPWVNGFPGQDKLFSKAWIANQLAKVLEPYSVKKASLISGVAYHYYEPVLQRNFKNKPIVHCAMQYGFDDNDYTIKADAFEHPWQGKGHKAIMYAGAFLPKSHLFIQLLFKAIGELRKEQQLDDQVRLYFFGTGQYKEKSILQYAADNCIADLVFEQRERRSYLQILNLLKDAYGVMVIGSTEMHYTASKVFQSVLSKTPVFTVFHQKSDAAKILHEIEADTYTALYDELEHETELFNRIKATFKVFAAQSKSWNPQLDKLDPYSAKASAKILVDAIEKVLEK